MEKTKQWYQSRAVWAGLFTAVIGILGTFGVTVADSPDSIADNMVALVMAVAGILAVVGRVKAKKMVKFKVCDDTKLMVKIIVLFALLFATGCNGPITVHDPAYLIELDQAAATTRALAEQCYAGQIDPNDCCDGLDAAHQDLAAFSDAAHGRDVEGGSSHE